MIGGVTAGATGRWYPPCPWVAGPVWALERSPQAGSAGSPPVAESPGAAAVERSIYSVAALDFYAGSGVFGAMTCLNGESAEGEFRDFQGQKGLFTWYCCAAA